MQGIDEQKIAIQPSAAAARAGEHRESIRPFENMSSHEGMFTVSPIPEPGRCVVFPREASAVQQLYCIPVRGGSARARTTGECVGRCRKGVPSRACERRPSAAAGGRMTLRCTRGSILSCRVNRVEITRRDTDRCSHRRLQRWAPEERLALI
jgi:hypothetical protein